MAKATCSIEGCDRPVQGRGWCSRHYTRWWRNGDPLVCRWPWGLTKAEAFWQRVDQTDACWLWTGYRDRNGYGRLHKAFAHRVAYELVTGPIPQGLQIDHLCRNPSCVRPEHLEAVTRQVNVQRAYAIRTHCPYGHLYDEANTYRNAEGHRKCRKCHALGERARTQRLRAGSLPT